MPTRHEQLMAAVKHFLRADSVIRKLMAEVGPFTLKPHRDRFGLLVRSIVSQQISTQAARSIRGRIEELVAPRGLTAEALGDLPLRRLRTAGVSPQKAAYLQDLCAHMRDGRLDLRRIGRFDDERVIEKLTQVRGIGRWTAQMFLIFGLGRLDVFPHDDLGIRTALRNLYGLEELPDRSTSERIAAPWRPYATIGSWYCWRSLELERNGRAERGEAYPV